MAEELAPLLCQAAQAEHRVVEEEEVLVMDSRDKSVAGVWEVQQPLQRHQLESDGRELAVGIEELVSRQNGAEELEAEVQTERQALLLAAVLYSPVLEEAAVVEKATAQALPAAP